jgi:hypothetical protein
MCGFLSECARGIDSVSGFDGRKREKNSLGKEWGKGSHNPDVKSEECQHQQSSFKSLCPFIPFILGLTRVPPSTIPIFLFKKKSL